MHKKLNELKPNKWNQTVFGKEQLPEWFLKSIERQGIRESLVIKQDGTIISGHRRFFAAQKIGLQEVPVRIENYNNEVEEREAFIDYNRYREKTFSQKMAEAEFIEETERKKARDRQGTRTDLKEKQSNIGEKFPESSKGRTRDKVAQKTGMGSGKTYDTAKKIWNEAKKGDDESKQLVDKIDKGEYSINQAYNKVKQKEKQKEIKQQKQQIEEKAKEKPKGPYDVVVIDPPWNYGRKYDPEGSRVASPYPEMNQKELKNLDIPFAENCVLWLWTTHQFIWDAKDLLDEWGFAYKATLVWDKENIGMGKWLRMQVEFCLLGIKGNPYFNNTSWRDIITEKRRQHSRKPDKFYEMVEDICAGKRIDWFARESREGWETYGNETNKFQ